jgi:hypothetical protein
VATLRYLTHSDRHFVTYRERIEYLFTYTVRLAHNYAILCAILLPKAQTELVIKCFNTGIEAFDDHKSDLFVCIEQSTTYGEKKQLLVLGNIVPLCI